MAYAESTYQPEVFEEAMQVYLKKSLDVRLAPPSIETFFHDKLLVSKVIQKGLTFTFFEKIQNLLSFDESDWADYLNISQKTMQRHKKANDYTFKPLHSEKILEIVELVNRGEAVFGSSEKFNHWMRSPTMALVGNKPFDLIKDSYGRALILEELNRIEHGIFA
ncbi:MAG TPA: antitoxin Xre/MbcA/ParS toxin-binding domain-containing protein [Cryomorphaceae bacterium]|nr:antitoxin Xre/MbcA/ParS toxin-binding domain-containing protein [Cryomorphaceae bacterium]